MANYCNYCVSQCGDLRGWPCVEATSGKNFVYLLGWYISMLDVSQERSQRQPAFVVLFRIDIVRSVFQQQKICCTKTAAIHLHVL